MREHLKSNIEKNSFYKWGRSRDSNPSPGIHSPGG